MNKLLVGTACCALFLSSCITTEKPLYSWGNYEQTSYNYYKQQTPEATEALLKTYEQMIKYQSQSQRKILPPGISAEYGYLLIQAGKKEEGLAMLENEIKTYPQSKTFIERIIKMVKK